MTISRRLFLGRVVPAAAAAPLLRPGEELDLGDPPLELREGDVLVVRVPDRFETSEAELERIRDQLRRDVWPDVLVIPHGVDLEVLRRSL